MKNRIHSIDIVRGLIMIIMTLDHTRDFLHFPGPSPTNMQTTTVVLFFTRWITHYCAPTFVFLAGVSAVLAGQRRSTAELRSFLLKRGAWLIASDLLFISLVFTLDPTYPVQVLEVLWATGFGMILLAALLRVPLKIIAAIAVVILLGHPYLPIPFLTTPASMLPFSKTRFIFELYPALPWASVLLLGYVVGHLYRDTYAAAKRRQILMRTGLICCLLFVVLRLINHFGDPAPWSVQRNAAHTLLSFLNATKQAPSLLFFLMTLGPVMILLAVAEKLQGRFVQILQVYGNVPYFYFIVHLTLLRIINLLLIPILGLPYHATADPLVWQAAGFGIPLWQVYIFWPLTVAALYYPCKLFGNYKRAHPHWWLSYL